MPNQTSRTAADAAGTTAANAAGTTAADADHTAADAAGTLGKAVSRAGSAASRKRPTTALASVSDDNTGGDTSVGSETDAQPAAKRSRLTRAAYGAAASSGGGMWKK